VKSDSIILSAPYKPSSFLKRMIEDKIGLIFLSYYEEITEIANYLQDQLDQDIGIRLRSSKSNKQLGLVPDEKSIHQIINGLAKIDNLHLTTLQLHAGTQLDPQTFRNNVELLLNAANLFEKHGISISQLDFGGGLPEASVLSEADLDTWFLALSENLHTRGWQNVTCLFEPGRFIVGDTGFLLTKIVHTFHVRQSNWIMVDTGNHHCPKFSNSNFRFELIHQITASHNTPVSIAGCLPTDMDVLAKRYPFPKSYKKGDNIAIFNAGAYTLTWSTRFSYPFPPILLVSQDHVSELHLPKFD